MMIPTYTPQEGAYCPHGLPDCLCDVHVSKVAPIFRGHHMLHDVVLDLIDADGVTERNLYQFLTTLLGCYETITEPVKTPYQQSRDLWEEKPCAWCGKVIAGRSDRITCSNACKLKKSRANRKAAGIAVR